MTYNEKKSLYESIMKEIAKTVKSRLNESYAGNKIKNAVNSAINHSKKHPDETYILSLQQKSQNGHPFSINDVHYINVYDFRIKNGEILDEKNEKRSFYKLFGEFTDDCFVGDIIIDQYELNSNINPDYRIIFKNEKNNKTLFMLKLSEVGIDKIAKLEAKIEKREDNKPQSERDFIQQLQSKDLKKKAHDKVNKKLADEAGINNPKIIDAIRNISSKFINDISWADHVKYDFGGLERDEQIEEMSNQEFDKIAKRLTQVLIDFYKKELQKYYN